MTDSPEVIETPAEAPAEAPSVTPHQQFLNMLPEDLRSDPTFEPYKGESVEEIVGKMAKSHVNVNKLVGADKNTVLKFPTSPDDKEAYNAIYEKLGRPTEVDGYELDRFTKDNPLADADKLKEFAQMAHDGGVSKEAFDKMVGFYYEMAGANGEAYQQNLDQTIEKYTEQLKSEWGDAYEAKTQKVIGILKEHATEDFKQLAADMPWIFDHPSVMKTIDNIVKTVSESGAPSSANTSADAPLSPDEAKAAISAMDGDESKMKILRDTSHPQRQHLLKEREKLFKYAYPG